MVSFIMLTYSYMHSRTAGVSITSMTLMMADATLSPLTTSTRSDKEGVACLSLVHDNYHLLPTKVGFAEADLGRDGWGLCGCMSGKGSRSEEQGVGRDDGRSDIGQGRPKGGGLTANPPGKPKKGRTGPRDGKKTRMSSDFDPDDEDDPDSSWR
ncbi:hypothetical protein Acr_24g0004580 [Actinidia rufa]|uniref:Uncharacterized protein n=1 Tax=Actinidia rufa TaxID=165716 RepID=A0A7J0GU05_9ERIC|nr:hypothetical protein Acr_24g0004580 [Actinidia rufa]